MSRLLVLALAVSSAAAQTTIAGYVAASDVSVHAAIDLDFAAMDTCLGSYSFPCAWNWYANGGNSVKSSGAVRTLRGFATSALDEEWAGAIWYGYWETNSYADNFITSATNATFVGDANNDFTAMTDTARDQLAGKGTTYQAVFRYVFHELEAAVEKCEDGNLDNDSGAPHAWDEGWAFYAGSLEGTAVGGSSSGVFPYRLAEKRCGNFGSCTSGITGVSTVNDNLLTLYNTGLAQSQAGSCSDLQDTQESIMMQSLIPLIQGTIKYTYSCDPAAGGAGVDTAKACAEGYAFAAAILPALDACDSSVATLVKSNLNLQLTSMVPDGTAAVVEAIQSVYDCLDISCDEVGGYVKTWDSSTSTGTYYDGTAPCADSVSAAQHSAPMGFALAVGLVGVALSSMRR